MERKVLLAASRKRPRRTTKAKVKIPGFSSANAALYENLREIYGILKRIYTKPEKKIPTIDKITPRTVLNTRGQPVLLVISKHIIPIIDNIRKIILKLFDKERILTALQYQLQRNITDEERKLGVTEENLQFLRRHINVHLKDEEFKRLIENFEDKKEQIRGELDEIRDYWIKIYNGHGELPKITFWLSKKYSKYNIRPIVAPFSHEIELFLRTYDLMNAEFIIEEAVDPSEIIENMIKEADKITDIKSKLSLLRNAERIATREKMDKKKKEIYSKIQKIQTTASSRI